MPVKTVKIPIEDATDDQLREFASLVLALDSTKLGNRQTMLGLIQAAWPQDFITKQVEVDALGQVQDQKSVQDILPQQRLRGSIDEDEPRVTVRIMQTEMPGGRDPVPIGVNGVTVVAQRNMDVSMPYRFYLALLNAVRTVVDQIPDPSNPRMRETIEIQVTNYPVTVVKPADPDAVKAWFERTKDLELA